MADKTSLSTLPLSTHINGDGREIEQAGVVGARVWSHFQQGGRSFDNGGDVKNLKLKRTGGRDSGIEKECLRWRRKWAKMEVWDDNHLQGIGDEDADTRRTSIGKACSGKVDASEATIQAEDLVVSMWV
ncbi:unnamed protein product [Lactuca saligna]|uniref:Uncharacterized protein n=1 Tax=Lactuca saligna TaxID=75948 RepID=A0AA35VJ05_LACSI|nr:unnamed protein product [Lactuca saligna]